MKYEPGTHLRYCYDIDLAKSIATDNWLTMDEIGIYKDKDYEGAFTVIAKTEVEIGHKSNSTN